MTWPNEFDSRLEEHNVMDLPGQQLAATHARTTLEHLSNLDIWAAPGCQRLTGIMASMGRATHDIEIMEKMMAAGMNIAFLNMSFESRDHHVECIKMLRQAAKNFGVTMGRNYPLAIAVRLSGRKMRTGRIAESFGDSVELKTGETLRLTTDDTYKDRCSSLTVYVDFMYFAEQMKKGNIILLDNETIELKVEMISSTTLTCKIERGGILRSNRDVFVPNVVLEMPDYTDKVKLDIEMAIRNKVDILIASFVSSANNIKELKTLLAENGKNIAIIANIQTIEGFRRFDEIAEVANGVMITRQELASDITPSKLALAQKNMIARANKINVPVCVSAHVLSSMTNSRIPLRAELLDIGNCILDGADCLVLGPETAIGANPIETVATLDSACREAEACVWSKQLLSDLIDKTLSPCDQVSGAAMTGVLAAQRCMASAIIVITASGKSAQAVAKFRPRCPILAITRHGSIAKQLHMWRGIIPLIYDSDVIVHWLEDIENRIRFGVQWAIKRGFVMVGDPIVIISGWKLGSGYTNTMRVIYVSQEYCTT